MNDYPIENLERLIIFALQSAGKGLTWDELIATQNLKNKPVVDIGTALRNLVDDGKLTSTHPRDFNETPVISLASPINPPVSETRQILGEVAKQPAYHPAPGEIHVPRDFEKKRGRVAPQPTRIELSRLAPPSEQGKMPQVGGKVRFPGRKRATVIHDPLTDRIKRKVEMHLGDVVENPDDEAAVSEEAWTLAIDAAQEVGLDSERAQRVARDVCRLLGYPRP
jgi:hypothetical protein